MKTFFTILLLNIPSILFKNEQNQLFTTQIIYNFTYQTDSLDVNTKRSELAELLINDSTSVFLTTKKYEQDSIFNEEAFKTGIAFRFGRINITQFLIWKNENKIITQEPLDGRSLGINNHLFEYQEDIEDLKWQLEEDTMNISQIKCQKAIIDYGGRQWIAWFSPDIPINNGPYKFTGLPGLIIRIGDTEGHYSFDLVHINQQQKTIIPLKTLRPDLLLEKTTKKEFQKGRIDLCNNMVLHASANMKLNEEQKKNISADVMKHSNWIEL